MNAPVDTLPVYGRPEPHTTQYGTSFVLSSSTAPMRSYTRSRLGRTDTRHDLDADFWAINAYVDCLDPVLAPARLTYAWPSARLLDSLGVCLRMTSTERSATAASATPTTRALEAELDRIITLAQHEDFEQGMSSQFEGHLRGFVSAYGESAITALHDRMQRGLKTDIAIEALGALGRMRQGLTRDARLATLAAFLHHRDAAIRDAAMRGLLDLDDKRARAPLLDALAAEPNKLLKKSLTEVLALLPK